MNEEMKKALDEARYLIDEKCDYDQPITKALDNLCTAVELLVALHETTAKTARQAYSAASNMANGIQPD